MATFAANKVIGLKHNGTPRVCARASPKCVAPANKRTAIRCMAEEAVITEDKPKRKPSPLEVGGTLTGDKALGKSAAKATLEAGAVPVVAIDGAFSDARWVDGRWDFEQFKGEDGEVDWDAVIDAEVVRRKILEATPEACKIDDPVDFDLSEIPWTAWVKRFHLPQAEMANGRAAMIGYVGAYLIDATTHISIVEQMDSWWGKLFLGVTLAGCLFIRRTEDLDSLKELADEATFYDRQWAATWDGVERPSEKAE